MGRRVALALAVVVALVASGCTAKSANSQQANDGDAARATTTTTAAVPDTTPATTEAPPTTEAAPTTEPPTTAAPAPRPRPSSSPADASAGAPGDSDPARARLGKIVADLGFRPDANGFVFENYGNRLPNGRPPTNLTADDVHRVFGDAVCQSTANGICDLLPAAGAWLDQTNKQMAGGHCYGFSVASLLLWRNQLAAADYGAGVTRDLGINDNVTLQRTIASEWTAQLLDSVRTNVVGGGPNQVLDTLIGALRPDAPEAYTLAFWKTDGSGGHAVLPFAVEDRGGGEFSVLIYDSNWPGQTRAINFDRNANTWSYAAAANPTIKSSLYGGDGGSNNLALYPLTPGLGTQPCPFCGTRVAGVGPTAAAVVGATVGAAATSAPTQEVFLVGSHTEHPDLLIIDDSGRRLGYVKGRLVQEIPGARVDFPLSNQGWRVKLAPHFVVPADARYTIRLDGSRLKRPQTETLSVIGPAFNVSIPELPVRPGDKEVLVLGHHGENLTYSSNQRRTPRISIGIAERDASYEFVLRGVSTDKGTAIQLGFPMTGGDMTLRNFGAVAQSVVGLQMTRRAGGGSEVFLNHALLLYGDARATVHYGQWLRRADRLPVDVTQNGATTLKTLSNDLA